MQPALLGAPWLIAHRSMLAVNEPYQIALMTDSHHQSRYGKLTWQKLEPGDRSMSRWGHSLLGLMLIL